MLLYAVTIFLSAFLLFQVQPLIAKIILPWFGGSAAVWSAAMLFFQLVLLAGYGYAHCSIRFLKGEGAGIYARRALAGELRAIADPAIGKLETIRSGRSDSTHTDAADRDDRVTIFPAFVDQSAVAGVVRTKCPAARMPYRLFALSNFGSMLALISFPFLVEPILSSRHQAYAWSGAYVIFAMVCGYTAWLSKEPRPSEAVSAIEPSARPRFIDLIIWVGLAAIASVLLVSITTHLSQNVAPIPLLWVLPLALYLATFMIAFESDKLYHRGVMFVLLVPIFYYMARDLYEDQGNLHIKYLIPIFSAGLFLCCMLCHGELARRRPVPKYLTLFYLMVSLGGALGGTFVTLIAPRIFKSDLELPLAIGACAIIAAMAIGESAFRRPPRSVAMLFTVVSLGAVAAALLIPIASPLNLHFKQGLVVAGCSIVGGVVLFFGTEHRVGHWTFKMALLAAVGLFIGTLGQQEREKETGYRLIERNFYGVLHIRDDLSTSAEEYSIRTLFHGTINHGSQILDEELRYKATSYYGEKSGVGRSIRALQKRGVVRVGVVGLGAGVLSNYGRAGDFYRIFEINPLVQNIAQTQFTFYPHSPADKRILMGDARLTMERMDSLHLDLLAVDAFSSDAIPIHLLTREAFRVYFRHLKPSGILAMHISNRYLDLEPVCAGGAAFFNRQAMTVYDEGDEAPYLSSSSWVLVTSDTAIFLDKAFDDAFIMPAKSKKGFRAWTDDYSNVVQILKLN